SASAARTSSSTPSAPTAARDTTPAATPSPVSRSAMTVSLLDLVTPLVVSVLPAHRRFAVLDSSAITMQSSARDSSSARSTASCGLMSVPSVRLRRACSRGLPSSRARPFVAARAPQSSPRGAPPARSLARLLQGVEDVDAAEQRRRAAVADRRYLPRLALAAVERAAQHVRLRAADGLHGVPEVGGGRLVGD